MYNIVLYISKYIFPWLHALCELTVPTIMTETCDFGDIHIRVFCDINF